MTVSEEYLKDLFDAIEADPQTIIEVNLPEQFINIVSSGKKASFDINSYKKTCLLNGYDDIDYLLSIRDQIETFEHTH